MEAKAKVDMQDAPQTPKEPILIVEDDAGTALLVQTQLRKAGWEADIAATGEAAITWLRNRRPALMLLDNSLPDITGEGLVELLGPAMPPFVVITGAGSERLAVTLMKQGAKDYLVKNATFLHTLQPVVARVLKELETERKLAMAERALRDSEAKFRIITESMNDVVWTLDTDTLRFLYVSPSVEKLRGFTPEEILAEPIDSALTPESSNYLRGIIQQRVQAFRSGLASDQFYTDEVEQPCKDGSTVWTEVITSYAWSEQTGHVVVRGVTRNIDKRKQAERALHESENRYRRITEGLTDYQYSVRVEAGQAVATTHSLGCEAVTGYTAEDFAADPYLWFRMIAPEDRQAARDRVEQVLAGQEIEPFEHRLLRKDGALRWVSDTCILNKDASGKLLSYDGVVQDITPRKQAEEALRESEARFRGLLQSVDFVGVQSYGPDGTTQYWNQASERIYGFTAEEAIGRNLLDLVIPPVMREDVSQAIRDMWESGVTIPSSELSLMRKDGSRVSVYSSHAIVRVPGHPPEMFCMDVDLSDRRRLEAQLHQAQKMESLGILAGGVAHDMNNVLGAILGLASVHLEVQPPDSPAHRAFTTITKACTRGGNLIRSLLGFARQGLAEEKELDLNGLVRDEVRLLERTTLARVRLEMDLAPDLWPTRGDASALTHVLMNLCVNAVDAMPDNGTLTLRTRNVDADWIEVQVVDTGSGMSKEVLEKAMDPFFTTKGQGKGTGLGLSIAHSTVMAHHGQMEILSEPGRGTTVLLRFPAFQLGAQDPEPVSLAQGIRTGSRLKVLLVDDDELIQNSMKAILEILGHTVVTHPRGEQALMWLDAGFEPDVVILDMNMPGMGGPETLRRLRLVRPEVPVLLATGRIDQGALNLVGAYAQVTLLPKPFGIKELRQHLEPIGPA